jgi:hypothetical protein
LTDGLVCVARLSAPSPTDPHDLRNALGAHDGDAMAASFCY